MNANNNEIMRVESVFLLSEKEYPKRKRTTIVITDDGKEIVVGVKAIARVYERLEDGAVSIHQEQYGDYLRLKREDTLDSFFSCIKNLFDIVPEIIEKKNEDI